MIFAIVFTCSDLTPAQDNLIADIPTFDKEYKISATININSFSSSWSAVFVFTLGRDMAEVGDRHPGFYINNDEEVYIVLKYV